MRRPFAVGIVLVCLVSLAQFPLARAVPQDDTFQPVEPLTVGAITSSPASVATGIVVLKVFVSKDGMVEDIRVQRALASVTESTIAAVKGWTFKPALMDGTPAASTITVVGVFNNQCVYTQPPKPPTPETKQQPDPAGGFQAVGVVFAPLPECPVRASLLSASVVIEASVDATGDLKATRVLRDVPPFTAAASQRLKDWKFTPARLFGTPIDSKVVLAFYIRQPASNQYQSSYLWILADPPLAKAFTWSNVAMVVSPG
jgi:hypothetical protein